jgi:hypothetical protein
LPKGSKKIFARKKWSECPKAPPLATGCEGYCRGVRECCGGLLLYSVDATTSHCRR